MNKVQQQSESGVTSSGSELDGHLKKFNASLIKRDGVVAVSFKGAVDVGGARVEYHLIPATGTLAKSGKWAKLSPEDHLHIVRSRINEEAVAQLEREITGFVLKASLLAGRGGVDPKRFWAGLVSPHERAVDRFSVVESRILAATERERQGNLEGLTKASVSLALYPESFELANSLPRKFIAVLGPTNSGKTHEAMEALAKARSGVYLAPLRLLGLENYERLKSAGVAVSLVTGDMQRITPNATHTAGTVEMVSFKRAVEVAVIDEVQLLSDPSRGAAWTAALCGVPAETVYLVGALTARGAIEAFAKRLGVELEVRVLSRKSKLSVQPEPVAKMSNLKKGDAVIAFSRKEVLRWAENIKAAGFSVAVIYGNLSPDVRLSQSALFREQQADILVGTDAIGMGLNNPISRVVFTSAMQFDGYAEDLLSVALAQQIAGRAGRYGMHDEGFVAGFDWPTHKAISKLMRQQQEPLPSSGFYVAPTLDHLEKISAATGERRLAALLELFAKHVDVNDEFFIPADLTEQIERAQFLDALPLPLERRFSLSLVPISSRVKSQNEAWQGWARALSAGRVSQVVEVNYRKAEYRLQAAEDACKVYSAYAWLGYRMPEYFPDGERAIALAESVSKDIHQMLRSQVTSQRSPARGHGRKDAGRRIDAGMTKRPMHRAA
ncbi:RNA helicase [Paraburkholderia sp. UCT31]|uniref:SUV3 domain-containing protein n=1 Tax=Paraburkholderia sp. UCT31 TaxID=2615209 RepID=UPI001655F4EF|nr:SUV3 C-terminal domain-containing protein [Paraburkholderia sp. UCT31]MBC8739765.1 RNA helicase [Paraburkholderia sp. UCT31]